MDARPSNGADSAGITATLRDVAPEDLPAFFEHQTDEEANRMAAFTAKDPFDHDAFLAHWTSILGNPRILTKTILVEGAVAGHLSVFPQDGELEVTYWIDRRHWGRGVASRALELLLALHPVRPLFARAAKDNVASLRVLQKAGFRVVRQERGFANARGREIDEYVLKLDEPA